MATHPVRDSSTGRFEILNLGFWNLGLFFFDILHLGVWILYVGFLYFGILDFGMMWNLNLDFLDLVVFGFF